MVGSGAAGQLLHAGAAGMDFFMKQVKTYRYSLNMEDYGGPTKKPTWLYSGLSDMFSQLLVHKYV